MQNEHEPVAGVALRTPVQAQPVIRTVVRGAISPDAGVEACDNDHNTDTERDIFFVKMT